MTLSDDELVEAARAARNHAYAPYSKFAVGAALQTKSGQVFTGVNVENASFGLTLCAERSAIVSAVSAGQQDFSEIAVVADTDGPVSPCGACRQVLAEFGLDWRVILSNMKDKSRELSVGDLLPGAFVKSELDNFHKKGDN
ncbi:MAG: cytidine deaminase [Planctomycetota bacterium]|nr:cytidine deaminase [Planctomycetota bacterium]